MRGINIAMLLGITVPLTLMGGPTFAQNQPATNFPANPLEITGPDPLLPNPPVSRPLSPQEIRQLSLALDELDAQATAQLKAGNKQEAFQIWNRELRLRRVLGPLVEVTALGRVGDIAWKETETTEIRLITERLQTIQKENRNELLPDTGSRLSLQRALGTAYLQVRDKIAAIGVFREILADARQRRDIAAEATALNTIADLQLNWFAYDEAAPAYQELLALMRANPNLRVIPYNPPPTLTETPESTPETPLTDIDVLEKLAYAYEQNRQPAEAIVVQQELVTLLQQRNNFTPLPALGLAIGDNFRLLNQMDRAVEAYQQTYTGAQRLQQYGYAADALKRLGELYTAQNQLEEALKIYRYLVDVERQSYNFYGQMMAYEQIGRIHQARQETALAVAAYQQGLVIARQLKYRESDFVEQITQLSQQR